MSNSRQVSGGDANVLEYCKIMAESVMYVMVACEPISPRLRVDHPGDGPTVEDALARRIDLCHASDILFLVYYNSSQDTSNGHSDSKGFSK